MFCFDKDTSRTWLGPTLKTSFQLNSQKTLSPNEVTFRGTGDSTYFFVPEDTNQSIIIIFLLHLRKLTHQLCDQNHKVRRSHPLVLIREPAWASTESCFLAQHLCFKGAYHLLWVQRALRHRAVPSDCVKVRVGSRRKAPSQQPWPLPWG